MKLGAGVIGAFLAASAALIASIHYFLSQPRPPSSTGDPSVCSELAGEGQDCSDKVLNSQTPVAATVDTAGDAAIVRMGVAGSVDPSGQSQSVKNDSQPTSLQQSASYAELYELYRQRPGGEIDRFGQTRRSRFISGFAAMPGDEFTSWVDEQFSRQSTDLRVIERNVSLVDEFMERAVRQDRLQIRTECAESVCRLEMPIEVFRRIRAIERLQDLVDTDTFIDVPIVGFRRLDERFMVVHIVREDADLFPEQ